MAAERFSREMGLTHAEFFRTLPSAIAGQPFQRKGSRVTIDYGERSVVIELGPERTRRIALLALPYTEVRFAFVGFANDQREQFMQRFDLYFRRGGG